LLQKSLKWLPNSDSVVLMRTSAGPRNDGADRPGSSSDAFNLDEVVPDDHLVRAVARVLDTSWVRAELAPHCSHTGRPSIDPVLMIRMLIVGCVNIMLRLVVTCR
jgi:transposase